ncbi:MAG: ABC transporter permease [Chloroflexia bacterium]|nr:ABC transporter permease [Chloroflexia bacterium]
MIPMIVANLKMTFRNRQAIFWNLAFPAIFILVFGAIFGGGVNDSFAVGVTGTDSELRQRLTGALEGNSAFELSSGEQAAELSRLREDERDVVVVFSQPDASGTPVVELFYSETAGPNAMIAMAAVRQVLLESSGASANLTIEQRPVEVVELSYIDFFVPGILAMSLMNSGVIGLSTTFVSFRERGILRRIKVTPFPLWKFILARILSSLVVAVINSAILIGLATLVFGLSVRGNALLILGVLLIGGLAFLGIGYAVAAISPNTETAASYANLITFPMLFLSGVFFSIDTAPGWLQPITRALPLSYLVDALRAPMMLGRGINAIWLDLVVLAATFVVCLAFAVRFFRWDATPR